MIARSSTRSHALVRPIGAASFLLLAACSSAPESYAPLANLEQRFEQARQDQVPAFAPTAFQDAERSLREAQSGLGQAAQPEIEHLTNLAAIRLDIAQTEARAARLREERQQLVAQRERILLGAREDQLALARRVAQEDRERIQQLEQQLSEYDQRRTDRGTVLTLRDIVFDLDSATLSPGAQKRLQPLADFLRENPDRQIAIEGYTDSSGADDYNLALSQQRADAVRNFLASQGVDAARITTRGLGESFPVADNATSAGRMQNRRIEVTIEDSPGGRGSGARASGPG